ncbi:type IIL restriction-modification enzyme MmeI [Deinococcus murrayi]|uniref:type IIL restriction-modification enzyme MmeI n=1 Tax=Deinococcus murrayi TaxID=68910 RepID=UPI000AAEB52C|nr:type IIL restriction-modification enzyme MmeI [Deinococcus murrayi]
MPTLDIDAFIQRWAASGGAERANYGQFLSELCRVLDVPEPEPTRPNDADNAYVFERNVYEIHDDDRISPRRIDLYRRGCFVLEAKQGVVTVLRDLHDELDALVQAAYGWEGTLTDQEVLTRLGNLNALRAEEERRGNIRYLREDYQDSKGRAVRDLGLVVPQVTSGIGLPPIFPKKLPEQVQVVRDQLRSAGRPLTSQQLASQFRGVGPEKMGEIVETLVLLGQVRQIDADVTLYAA